MIYTPVLVSPKGVAPGGGQGEQRECGDAGRGGASRIDNRHPGEGGTILEYTAWPSEAYPPTQHMHMRHEMVRTARDIEPKPNGATQMPQAQTVSYAMSMAATSHRAAAREPGGLNSRLHIS
jgi:hypothetical protein